MESFRNRLNQDAIDRHFVRLAEGHKPERKGKLTLFSGQSGRGGGETGPKVVQVTPAAQAVEQARSDLKRGLDQPDALDVALENDAKRKKRSTSREARRKRKRPASSSRSKSRKKSSSKKKKKKKRSGKKTTSKARSSSSSRKRTAASRKKKRKPTNGKSKSSKRKRK